MKRLLSLMVLALVCGGAGPATRATKPATFAEAVERCEQLQQRVDELEARLARLEKMASVPPTTNPAPAFQPKTYTVDALHALIPVDIRPGLDPSATQLMQQRVKRWADTTLPGNRLSVGGTIESVQPRKAGGVDVRIKLAGKSSSTAFCTFDAKWEQRLATMKEGARIKASGVITEINLTSGSDFIATLADCSIDAKG